MADARGVFISMRKVITGVLLLAIGAIVGVVAAEWRQRGEGLQIAVLLHDPEGLRTGDEVLHDGRVIGRVEDVSAEGSRVRVAVRLEPSSRSGLTRSSTFRVEQGGDNESSHLEAYPLDDRAPPLSDGDVIDGVTSKLELTIRKAAVQAGRVIDQAAESAWVKDGARRIDRLVEEFERTDWSSLGHQFDGHWDRVGVEMRALAQRTREEAKRAYRNLEPDLNRLLRELEAAGKSAEAEDLRRQLRDLFREAPLTPEAPVTPEALPPPPEPGAKPEK